MSSRSTEDQAYYRWLAELLLRNNKAWKVGFRDLTDLSNLGDPGRWGPHLYDLRRLMFVKHLNHKERFRLTLFFLVNGAAPHHILAYYAANGSLFDGAALCEVLDMLHTALDPTRQYIQCSSPRWASWDVRRGLYVHLSGKPYKGSRR